MVAALSLGGVSLQLIDELDLQIAALTVQLKRQGVDHGYIPLLVTAPGNGPSIAYTIAPNRGLQANSIDVAALVRLRHSRAVRSMHDDVR